MGHPGIFAAVLEAIDRMPVEDQEALIEIARRRALERRPFARFHLADRSAEL